MCNYEMNQAAVLFSRVLEEAADVHHLDCGFGDPRKLDFSVSVSRVETEGKDSQKCILTPVKTRLPVGNKDN